LILSLAATVATAFSWSPMALLVLRFLTGAGIGREYSAVNSATDEAERIAADIERHVSHGGDEELPDPGNETITIDRRARTPMREVVDAVFRRNSRLTWLGLALMAGQPFLYNVVFFTFAITLTTFFKVANGVVGWYLLLFAVGNFLGPRTIGRLVDTVGRSPMIAGTYLSSAVGTATVGLLGYRIGGGLMLIGAVAELALGLDAEQRSLEDVATPLAVDGATTPTL
jgi:MFS family permease